MLMISFANKALKWLSPDLHSKVVRAGAISAVVLMGSGVIVFYAGSSVVLRLIAWRKRHRLTQNRIRKQKQCKKAIAELENKLKQSHIDESITALSMKELSEMIQTKQLKAVDVLRSYQAKAISLHKSLNCLVEPIAEAEIWAQAVDDSTEKAVLAGIPFSVKEDIGIKGYESTTGASVFLGQPNKYDSAIIKMIKEHGGIPFMRTNLTQLCLCAEPGNPIFGTVSNPIDPKRSPGGSSSGEGALIGAGGSVIGFGSDVGGSIRIPSHNCGICGFKPTSQRISQMGNQMLSNGIATVTNTWGPLARDVDSLIVTMRAFWDRSQAEIDPLTPPIGFNEELFQSKKTLKIGYYVDNGEFAPVPACIRAVLKAKDLLEKAGHTVVPWEIPDVEKGSLIAARLVCADGGEEISQLLKFDEVDPVITLVYKLCALPKWIKILSAKCLSIFMPYSKQATFADITMGARSVLHHWRTVFQQNAYKHQVISAWKKQCLDAVICPPMPCPALPLGTSMLASRMTSYCHTFNVLNFPAGVVPMTHVTIQDEKEMKTYPLKDGVHKEVKQHMVDTEGLPVGVQVVSLTWQDEMCLRVMKEVERAAISAAGS